MSAAVSMPISIALVALSAVALSLLAYTFHKVRRVHLMTFRLSDEINQHSNNLFRQIEALQALYAELKMSAFIPPTRGWSASPDFLLLIASYVRKQRPVTIIECGSGTSTVVLARALQLNGSGRVYSLESDPSFAQTTRDHLERCGLGEWSTVIDAKLCPLEFDGATYRWYSLSNLPDTKIDMLVIDGPPESVGAQARYPAGPCLFPLLNAGATVFLDDAVRDDELRTVERWMQTFPTLERQDYDCEKGCASFRVPREN